MQQAELALWTIVTDSILALIQEQVLIFKRSYKKFKLVITDTHFCGSENLYVLEVSN